MSCPIAREPLAVSVITVVRPPPRVLDSLSALGDHHARRVLTPSGTERLTMASFFENFTPQEVARISAAGRRLKLPEGWSPIWENTPADKAYILLDGTVSVRQHGEEIAQIGSR